MSEENILIVAGYQITSSESDVSLFANISLGSSDIREISGLGKLSNEQGQFILSSSLIGEARTYWVEGPRGILVNITGYPFYLGIPPVGCYIPPNLKLRMVLNDSWNSGKSSAEYSYFYDESWHHVDNATARLEYIKEINLTNLN
ncbi:DUF1842 domain-containing protein [Shewanella surugensis]|uniref:DUF1842 domain-containing protein n=1 Tax=Shewanella surugensis TaxID=212020 RepID=A0ABT0LFN2_9GAMM|nr:DUF1842 domain-containing protein [Shewanella surugensis]MCL1126514.1 DUF1842 domain-containing protein [Shewanella surugensis]